MVNLLITYFGAMKCLLLLAVILISCGNPKEKIVNRQIENRQIDIEKQLEKIDGAFSHFTDEIALFNMQLEKPGTAAQKAKIEADISSYRDSMALYIYRKDSLVRIYDSLEMELKKN
ncbi:MAG TPA: hypothetical protein VF622_02935 [Segetibacter sp.]|jgi:hypothetical protein